MQPKTTILDDKTAHIARQLEETQCQLERVKAEHLRLLDTIDEIPMTLDPESFRIIKISTSCQRITGYDPEEMLDNTCGWKSYVHPDDRYMLDICSKELAHGKTIRKQYRITHKDGQIRWVESKYMPVEVRKGQPTYLHALIKDITKAKRAQRALMESEHVFRQFFDRAHEAIVVLDISKGTISDYNKTALELFKCSGSDMLNHSPVSLSPEYQPDGQLSAARSEALIQSAIKNERPIFEWTFQDADSKLIPCEVRLSNVTINDRTLIMGSITDITERKRAAAEVMALNQSLEQKVKERTSELVNANSQLERFSYTVSHDLQAPLRVVTGYSSLLIEDYNDKLDDGAKEMLNVINTNIRRMGQLIKDLLEFAKLGNQECNKTSVDMTMIVQAVTEEVRFHHPECRAEISINPIYNAHCDHNLIKQVWSNLVSNAIKYSSKKENPVVEIGSSKYNDTVTYYVRDNGTGFDMAYAQKLFKVFSRLHGVSEFEGTGIGLATVHSIIIRHGGRVWAEATPDLGATFYFTLPV